MAVKSARVTSSGSISGSPCKVLSIHGMGGAGVGTVILKDGGASGTTKITADTANAGKLEHPIAGGGMVFGTDCYATLGGGTAPAGISVDYEDYT